MVGAEEEEEEAVLVEAVPGEAVPGEAVLVEAVREAEEAEGAQEAEVPLAGEFSLLFSSYISFHGEAAGRAGWH